MKPKRAWFPQLGKYLDVRYETAPVVRESLFRGVNIIDFLFRVFVFLFIFLPLSVFCVAVYFAAFGFTWGLTFIGVAFVLVVLCLMSQLPSNQILPSFGTLLKAIIYAPVLMIGAFFLGKLPFGVATITGVGADLIGDSIKRRP